MKIFMTVFCLTVLTTDCDSTKVGLSTLKPKVENNVFIYKNTPEASTTSFTLEKKKSQVI